MAETTDNIDCKSKRFIPNYKLKSDCGVGNMAPSGPVINSTKPEFPFSIVPVTASEEARRLDLVWRKLSVAEKRKIMKMPSQQRFQHLRYLRNTTKIYPIYVKTQSETVITALAEHWCLAEEEVQGIVKRLEAGGRLPANIRADIGAFRELQAHRVLESHERTRTEIEKQIDAIEASKDEWVEIQMENGLKGITTKSLPREKALLQLHKARDATFKLEADTLPMYIPEPVKETEVRISADIESMSQGELQTYIAKSQKQLQVPEREKP